MSYILSRSVQFWAFVGVCLPISSAQAQAVLELDVIETEAENIQAPSFDAHLEPIQTARSTTCIQDTAGILERVSSVHISDNGNRLQRKNMSFRGASSQDIVVQYRNVPINSLSEAGADLSAIPSQLFDSVLVSNAGSGNVLGAVGGFVQLVPARSDLPLNASVLVSSMRDFSLFGRGMKEFERSRAELAVFGDYSPGRFRYIDAQGDYQLREHNSASRFGAQIAADWSSEIGDISAFSLYSQIERQEAGLSEYPARYRYATQDYFLSLTGIHGEFKPVTAGKAYAQLKADVTHRTSRDVYDNPTAFIGGRRTFSNFLENRTQLHLESSFLAPKYSETIIDLGYEYQHVQSVYLVSGTMTSNLHDRHVVQVGVSEHLSFWEDLLELSAGMRLDAVIGSDPLYLPAFSVRVSPHDDIDLWLNTRIGARYPSFDELWYQTEYLRGNPDLKPQKSAMHELGISYHPGDWLDVSVAGFYNFHQNIIRFLAITPYLFTAENIERVRAGGLEVHAKSKFWCGFSIRADYTLMYALTSEGYDMPTAPRHRVHAELAWDDSVWHAAIVLDWQSRISRNMSGTSYIPARLRPGIEATLTIAEKWHLSMSILNLFNDMRSEDIFQHPLPGRQAWIGVSYQ